MDDSGLMRLAIGEAKKSVEKPGCGAVVARDGVFIASAFNTQKQSLDSSAHAEMNAIRMAGKALQDRNLNGCTIYCTCEPCVMCLSAIAYAKIERVVYGLAYRETYPPSRIIDIPIGEFLSKSPRKFEVVPNFMREECRVLL